MEKMEQFEIEYMTQTKQRILENRKRRGDTPDQVFVNVPISKAAKVYHHICGEAMLAYLAALGTWKVASEEEKKQGFVVRTAFQLATGLGNRQFRRGLFTLAKHGYIHSTTAPGRKPRIRLPK